MSTLRANTLKPITSGNSLVLQGDSGGSGVSGPSIDSNGDVDFSQNTNAKIKLPSAGGIYQSDGSTQVLTESGGSVTIITGNIGINESSPDEKIHLSDGNFKIEKTGTSAYQEIFGADEYFTSTSSSAFDILTVTVPYTSDYNDAVTAKFRIHFHYYTWDTGTPRSATTVGEFLVLITRGSRAGNGASADQSLVSIGFEGTDTGGGTSSIPDISNFATSRTGGTSATQTITVQYTPKGVKSSGCRTQVNVKFESLNYGYSDITFAGF